MPFAVSLLVRLWVEMLFWWPVALPVPPSASSWGCELKYQSPGCFFLAKNRQPPREAVSWNNIVFSFSMSSAGQPPREAVSWNRLLSSLVLHSLCQPPREAVSWNAWTFPVLTNCFVSLLVRLWVEIISQSCMKHLLMPSASSWGCELKYSF